jgi:hypothetical protein
MTRLQRIQSLVTFLALLCLPLGVGWTAASGPPGTKTVDVEYLTTPFDAVTITDVTVGGRRIRPGLSAGAREDKAGTPFQADQDWLRDMSIFLKNRTDKVIVSAEIDLFFPDTGDGSSVHPVTAYTITVGQQPEWSMYFKDGSKKTPLPIKKSLFLAPGKTYEIRLADYLEEIQSHVEEKMLFTQVTRVTISRGNFYFADGMRWDAAARGYYIPKAGSPGHYTELPSDYFPGRPSYPDSLAQNPKTE